MMDYQEGFLVSDENKNINEPYTSCLLVIYPLS